MAVKLGEVGFHSGRLHDAGNGSQLVGHGRGVVAREAGAHTAEELFKASAGDVLRGDLEEVEELAAALEVDGFVHDAGGDLVQGELDGVRVFDDGQRNAL